MIDLAMVEQAYTAFNRRDIDALLEFMHADVVIEPLVTGVTSVAPWHGHAGVRRLVDDADARWNRFELRCDDLLEAGDRLVAFVHVTTMVGEDGVSVEGDVAHLLEVESEQLTRLVAYRDRDAAVAAARLTA